MEIKHFPYKKEKKWVVYWKSIGTKKSHHQGFSSESDAVAFASLQEEINVKERKLLLKRKATKRSGKSLITVSELFKKYFSVALKNKNTIKQGKYHAEHIIGLLGNRKISSLTGDDINRFIEFQNIRNLCLSTINNRISMLKRAINWGNKSGLFSCNPLVGIRLKRARARKSAPPTPSEARAIYESATDHIKRVVVLGVNCGPRIGPSELFKLTWDDIDLDNAIMWMPNADKGATDLTREIPIKAEILPLLKEWRLHDLKQGIRHVITWRSKPVSSINRAWHTALKKAGITRRIVPYSLRHSFATYAIQGGAKLKAVSQLMGQRNEKILLETYQHLIDGQAREAIEALPDFFNLAPPKKSLRKTNRNRVNGFRPISNPMCFSAFHQGAAVLYARLIPYPLVS